MEKELPKGWVDIELDNVANVLSGTGFPKKFQGNQNGKYPFFKVGDISRNFLKGIVFISDSDNKIDDEVVEEIKGKILPKNTIVFAKIGEALKLNRRAILKQESLIDNNAIGVKAFEDILNDKLLFYLFQTIDLINLSAGNAIPSVRKSSLENLKIPLPPRAEQERIVAKVDALMAQHAAIQQAMERIPQLLKDFRQQVLTQAVTGKLTEEWRVGKELEDGTRLFIKAHKSRLSKLEKADKPNYLKYDVSEINEHEIKSWYIAPVGLTNDCIVPGRDKPKSFTGNIPWITTPDLTEDFISISKQGIGLTQDEITEVKAKIIPKNSVIISIVGRFGISAILKTESVINQQLHAFLPSELIKPKFLMYYFKTLEKEMNNLSSSTTIAYINKTKVNSLKINVPSFDEQQEIVRRVESLFEKATAIEQRYEQLKSQIDTLPQAILHKAFKGELVEQLDSDGSAVELLKEIEGMRNLSKKKK